MTAAVIEVAGVVKRFGPRLVLDHVDLVVGEHQVVCLIGASGSGKSTLLRCANGLEPVDAGTIRVDGHLVTERGADLDRIRRSVGIVFQAFNLFPHMTVLANVTLAPRKVLGLSREAADARARPLLERIGLWEHRDSFPDRLSGGQQQRVALVRALAMEPAVLLLDEVTSALDPTLVGEVLALIREMAADGTTMVIATHEMAFAREVSDAICFLHDGRIVEQGPPNHLFDAPVEPETQAFLSRIRTPG